MPQLQPEKLSHIIKVTESKTLPDGSIVFECVCGKTVARVVDRDGYRRLKIMLTGRQDYYHCEDFPRTEAYQGQKRHRSFKVPARPFERDDYNLGGFCPLCHKRAEIGAECVVQAVGYEGLSDFNESYNIASRGAIFAAYVSALHFQQFVLDEYHDVKYEGLEGITISEKQAIKKSA